MMRRFCLLVPSLLAFAFACAEASNNPDPGPDPLVGGQNAGGGSGSAGTGLGGASGGQPGGGAGGVVVTAGSGGSPVNGDLLLYAHTDLTLYKVNPANLGQGLVEIGAFDCVGNVNGGQDKAMTDLAVDRNENVWGVSDKNVHLLKIDAGTKVTCEKSIELKTASKNPDDVKFYGLTFAPLGTLAADREVLVAGNTAGELWSIDDQGELNLLGHFGDVPSDDGNGNTFVNKGKRWELSGDIVFVEGKGTPLGFATVRDCPNPPSTNGCNPVNTLIEIDMTKLGKSSTSSVTKSVRGQIVRRNGCGDKLGGNYGNMFGIAAWNDRIYGFSRDGHLVDVSINDGTGCLVKTFDATKFSGAGVTTIVPVEAPIE